MSKGTRTLKRFFRKHAKQPTACFRQWAHSVASPGIVAGPQELQGYARDWLRNKGIV